MRRRLKLVLLLAVLLHVSNPSQAQYDVSTMDLEGNLDEWYTEALGTENQDLFEGTVYVLLRLSPTDHYFYGSDRWQKGELFFNGRRYQDIEMIYDLVDDVLVIRNINFYVADFNGLRIKQSLIGYFQLDGALFVRLGEDAPDGTGFYQHLYESDLINLYVRKSKVQKESDSYVSFDEVDDYYFHYKDEYYPVSGPASFYKAFPNLEKQIRQLFKRKRIRPVPGRDLDLRVAAHEIGKMLKE